MLVCAVSNVCVRAVYLCGPYAPYKLLPTRLAPRRRQSAACRTAETPQSQTAVRSSAPSRPQISSRRSRTPRPCVASSPRSAP